jgi:predicted metal-dependent hydrolase
MMAGCTQQNCGGTPQTRPAAGRGSHLAEDWRDREEFKARVLEWARTLDVAAKSIYVRPMRRKWASCSTAGTLSFNDELLDLARDLGDYVIVHELLHFSVPNHGKLWKSLMRVHLGDWESVAARLPQQGAEPASRIGARDAGPRNRRKR